MGLTKQTISSTWSHGQPEAAFWENYSRLWQNSPERSPFQCPQILRYFSSRSGADTLVFQAFNGSSKLIGAALFQKGKHAITFLSDMKTDANFFTLHPDCQADELDAIFKQFLEKIKQENWAFSLNNQPHWSRYLEQFDAIGQNSNLYWLHIPYSVCPIVQAKTPDALHQMVNNSRELRYRMNKLKNQKNASFEVLTDDADLDHWVDEFCQAHILRWASTATPSGYRSLHRQAFLKNCLHAWAREGILVRFSVVVEGVRIGFVVGLLEAGSLIHHTTTFHPDYWKFSPGKALILFMTEWMKANNLNILDFGDGDEPYKYSVATDEHVLSRIFIASRANLRFIVKTRMIRWIKAHPKLYQFYTLKIKRILP